MKKKLVVKQNNWKKLNPSEVDLMQSNQDLKTSTNVSTPLQTQLETANDKPIDFDQAVKQAANSGIQKRGRGRPPGSKSHKLDGENQKTVVDAPSSAVNLPPPSAPVNLPVELTTGMLQAPFAIYAKRTGFEGFQLEKETADSLNPAINECISKYFPAGMGEHAALFTLVGTLGFVAFSKYMAYQDFLALERHKAEQAQLQK